MKYESYEGKTKEEIISNNKLIEDEYLIYYDEKKSGLFKSSTVQAKAYKLTDICQEIKEYLQELIANMNIPNATFETKVRDGQILIKLYSDNNAILIGKNGQTLSALQTVARQFIFNKINLYPYLLLDVENYKDKQRESLERLAKNIASEVRKTKKEIKMENMNSYERRIVHNILTEFKGINAVSEGEEPNRHIVISPVD